MDRSSTTFQPGHSGNPRGRPRRGCALTELLEERLDKTVTLRDGTRISGKQLLARMVWELVITLKTTTANGTEIVINGRQWFNLVKWLYAQIDGPPKAEGEAAGSSDLVITYVNDWRGDRA